ncbi:MAG TPA: hypothetical protein VF642_12425 [Propionibacteriaceae bacterium]|jgi:hypothetical protein
MKSLLQFLHDVVASARIMFGRTPRCCFCGERHADLESHMRTSHAGDIDLQRRAWR